MKLRLFRNATIKLAIAGKTILIDPFFAPKGTTPSYTGRAPQSARGLPASVEDPCGVLAVIRSSRRWS